MPGEMKTGYQENAGPQWFSREFTSVSAENRLLTTRFLNRLHESGVPNDALRVTQSSVLYKESALYKPRPILIYTVFYLHTEEIS